MNNSTHIHQQASQAELAMKNLYPALIECFVIILAGYLAGRTHKISTAQSKGIGSFVFTFCLPALLFKSMCELKFHEVNWKFLACILLSKTLVFTIVTLGALLVYRPVNLGYAGIFGIFATQSNDFALGYPIIKALYSETHPDYLEYIYLVAPISLVFLNPIGFTLMEIQKHRQTSDPHTSKIAVGCSVVLGVVRNPIVFMTAVGIAGNFIFRQSVPFVLNNILEVLGSAFSASALFYLGLNLVGKMSGKIGFRLAVPLLLILGKILILPLTTWEVVSSFKPGRTSNETKELSMYGFLYSTIPTAPSVFLYASHYSIAMDTVATGLVLCTILSAPFMFVSASMMMVFAHGAQDYKKLLQETTFDISILSTVCCLWVVAVFFIGRRWKRMPHQFTICLVFSQLMSAVGMICYHSLDSSSIWQRYLQFVIMQVGVLSTLCWVAVLAVALYIIQCQSLCLLLRLRTWLFLFGFGAPIFTTGILLIISRDNYMMDIDPSYQYGWIQALVTALVTVMCVLMTVPALVLWFHSYKNASQSQAAAEETEHLMPRENEESCEFSHNAWDGNLPRSDGINAPAEIDPFLDGDPALANCEISLHNQSKTSGAVSNDIEDLVPYPATHSLLLEESSGTDTGFHDRARRPCTSLECSKKQHRRCAALVHAFVSSTFLDEELDVSVTGAERDPEEIQQMSRHVVLLIIFLLPMFVTFSLNIWRLFAHSFSGVYIEIVLLDCILTYGQGFITFLVFGLDIKFVINPFVKWPYCLRFKWFSSGYYWWRRCVYGVEVTQIPGRSEISEETSHTCEQFVKYHMENCVKEIVANHRCRLRVYHNVFMGESLCDWLIEAGLASDRGEAIKYGQNLLLGEVIEHVKKEHNFHDHTYFYRFLVNGSQ